MIRQSPGHRIHRPSLRTTARCSPQAARLDPNSRSRTLSSPGSFSSFNSPGAQSQASAPHGLSRAHPGLPLRTLSPTGRGRLPPGQTEAWFPHLGPHTRFPGPNFQQEAEFGTVPPGQISARGLDGSAQAGRAHPVAGSVLDYISQKTSRSLDTHGSKKD